ncbi:MAG: hypothetical protein KAI43_09105 [Candidatus Aureabacteria bacterium]|nr:hypothetical protein [Candidatus Auribacterota bacterium]
MFRILRIFLVVFISFQSVCFAQSIKPQLRAKLRKEGVRQFELPIHDQNKEWLLENFSQGATKYPININLLLRNIIWQQRQERVFDKKPLFDGNIRSFWYAYIKGTLAEAGVLNPDFDQYNSLIKQLTKLIKDADVMRYKDIGFMDDNKHRKIIGENYHIIVFAEKEGQFPFLMRLNKKYGVTVISLGGVPSLLSAEYFIDDMKAKGIDVRQKFYLFSLVDYDPSGSVVRNSFVDHLRFYGIKTVEVFDLVRLDLLTEEELNKRKYPLPKGTETKNKNWLKKTNGINGELYGLETEALHPKHIEELLVEKIEPLMGKQK